MINLRYHIITIVAVFLALGLGVALGSSFIDGAIVSQLEQRVDQLESERDQLRDEVAELENTVDAVMARQLEVETAAIPLIGGDRLGRTPVMIVADEGIDEALVEQVRATVLGSAARYDGALYLEDVAALATEEEQLAVATLLSQIGRAHV